MPPDTLAWREGLDNWYPLSHETWAEVGIVASVAPTPVPQPVAVETEKVAPTEEEHTPAGVGEHEPLEANPEGQLAVETVPEEVGKAFSEYAEEDFKPPSFDEMDQEMSSLRADRESLPSLIGERAFDAGIEDEEIEDDDKSEPIVNESSKLLHYLLLHYHSTTTLVATSKNSSETS